MARYPDHLSLLVARSLFFRDAKLGPDGGYGDRWVRIETKPVPFFFPNWPSRVAAARLHDLHHIAAEYETDWPGEAEIAAWEIASGCAGYRAAWFLNVGDSEPDSSLRRKDFFAHSCGDVAPKQICIRAVSMNRSLIRSQ